MNRFLILLVMCWISGCSFKSIEYPEQKILFVVSNAYFYGDSDINTGNHFAEIVFAYDVFQEAGYAVDFVSPQGDKYLLDISGRIVF